MKDKIAKWYKQRLWTSEMVLTAARKGVITAEDASEILGSEEESE